MIKKVLLLVSSHEENGESGIKTSLTMQELVDAYYTLLNKNIECTIASPKGGLPPIESNNIVIPETDVNANALNNEEQLNYKLSHSLQIVNLKEIDFDALLCLGGAGVLWDLSIDKDAINLIESFYRNNKPVAFVSHAAGILQFASNTLGEPLVKGKKVTGFSDNEQLLNSLNVKLPFSVENMLKQNGADYSKGSNGEPFIIQDGLLITGQNSASTKMVAEKLTELL